MELQLVSGVSCWASQRWASNLVQILKCFNFSNCILLQIRVVLFFSLRDMQADRCIESTLGVFYIVRFLGCLLYVLALILVIHCDCQVMLVIYLTLHWLLCVVATPASSKLNPSPSQNLDAANQRRWNPANNNSQSKTTLRWAGQLDDPDEESKRIEIYKSRRRERYAKYVLQSQSPNTNYQCQPITFKIPNIYATASGSNRLSSLYKTTPAMSKVLSMT